MLTDRWRKSSLSGSTGGGCVEARLAGGSIEVRDSKARGAGPVLTFTPREWRAFLGGVPLGDFDLPRDIGA
ncbi:DUF397 domain-containing protein [Nonomuraea thailandensis]|uniref:DUF397 domain-containing protein n=1 Tax=Nonomuraea thailandensis TaxID=1188745 RepID=UPI0020A3916F|nr:DUF397 domain-containing protein [Nonomuraea thailandensis]